MRVWLRDAVKCLNFPSDIFCCRRAESRPDTSTAVFSVGAENWYECRVERFCRFLSFWPCFVVARLHERSPAPLHRRTHSHMTNVAAEKLKTVRWRSAL